MRSCYNCSFTSSLSFFENRFGGEVVSTSLGTWGIKVLRAWGIEHSEAQVVSAIVASSSSFKLEPMKVGTKISKVGDILIEVIIRLSEPSICSYPDSRIISLVLGPGLSFICYLSCHLSLVFFLSSSKDVSFISNLIAHSFTKICKGRETQPKPWFYTELTP